MLLPIFLSTYLQSLLASVIKAYWIIIVVIISISSGCLFGCSPDATHLQWFRAIGSGPWNPKGAQASKQLYDIMLKSLYVTPRARTWAIISFNNYVPRARVNQIVKYYSLTLKGYHSAVLACGGAGGGETEGRPLEEIELKVIERTRQFDEMDQKRLKKFDWEKDLPSNNEACRAVRYNPESITYYAIVAEGAVNDFIKLRKNSDIWSIVPVMSGAGTLISAPRPEDRKTE